MRSKYNDDANDRLELEDATGRVALTGTVPTGQLVTGVVAAFLGSENSQGEFVVEDSCFVGLGPQAPVGCSYL